MGTHMIKWREVGRKGWYFMSKGGGGNRLRVHALRFTEENAQKFVEELRGDNPDFEFKIVS